MTILIVCSGNKGRINPFITEQADSLQKEGIDSAYFVIKKKGILGYLSYLRKLKQHIRTTPCDLVHAHYGLSGLLATLQRKIPVVVTFHGSDIKKRKVLRFSRIAARLAAHNIVVERSFKGLLGSVHKTSVIPCGVDFDTFFEMDQREARRLLGYGGEQDIVLFASSFDNPVKNYPLAKAAIELSGTKPLLIELKNYSRPEVNLLMNAADVLLMTSFTEGSPQVIKEAIACRLPVISTAVGDVEELSRRTDGITIVPYDARAIANELDNKLIAKRRIQSNSVVHEYNNRSIALKIKDIYSDILKPVD